MFRNCGPQNKTENCGPSSCAFLAEWTNPNQRQVRISIAIMGSFEISKLNFLKTKLDNNNSEISRTEWNAYFEPGKCHHKSKIASLQK